MSDGESTTPARRERPSYGLPGPTAPAPGAARGVPGTSGSASGSPHAQFGAPASSSPGPYGAEGYGPQTGPLPAIGGMGGSGSSGGPRGADRPTRRRGLWPLISGRVLLLVIGPAAIIGGIVWSLSDLAGDTSTGPTVLAGATSELEVPRNEMLILYVPKADSATAECTAEGATPGTVSTVPSSSPATFGDGSEYVQVLGVAVLEDTTVTITCTGTEAPAYLGPYNLVSMAGPLLIGPILGVIAGLIGLVLTIIGIVLLVRSRRS